MRVVSSNSLLCQKRTCCSSVRIGVVIFLNLINVRSACQLKKNFPSEPRKSTAIASRTFSSELSLRVSRSGKQVFWKQGKFLNRKWLDSSIVCKNSQACRSYSEFLSLNIVTAYLYVKMCEYECKCKHIKAIRGTRRCNNRPDVLPERCDQLCRTWAGKT